MTAMSPRLSLFPLAAALVLAVPAASAESRIFDLPYETRELDNGLRVIVVPTDTPGTVSIQIPVQTGSRNEIEPGKSGFAHFFEHMMFRGTPTYPADAYGAVIKNAGADQNAYTSSDLTNYHTNFTSEDLEKIIEVEADRFQNLAYSEEQFRTEALAVKGEYLKNFSNPIQKAFEKLSEIAFSVHPYGHTTMGYLADIEDMPNQMDYSKEFFDRWYRPEYTTVILVGDVEPARTFELVEKYWGNWERGSYRVDIPQEPPLDGPKYEHIAWEAPTLPWLLNSWRGPSLDTETPDTAALMLLSELYFGSTSELYQKLVVRERWVDQLFAGAPQNKDPGLFYIGARLTDGAHAPAVTEAIQATLVQARHEAFDPQKLAETKSRVKYGFAATLNSAASIGATLARFVHYERDPETINRLYAQFDRVTPEQIMAAANRVFIDSNRASVSIANGAELAGANVFGSIDAAVAAASRATPAASTRVIELPSDSPLINVALRVQAGAAFDPPGKKGLAALTASMLTQGGTAKRRYEDVQAALYPLAAGLSAQVDKETVLLSGTVHRDNIEAWYAVVREMLLEPGFREEDLVRLKQQQVNAIRTSLRANNDEELGKEALYEMVYGPEHPYGSLTLGHAKDVEALTLDDVRAFHAARYDNANATLALSGNYGDAFRQRMAADLARLSAAMPSPVTPISLPALQPRKARIIQKETPAVAVSFGWPIDIKRGDADWPALWLVRSYLGEHRNSSALLYQRIRETRGMNYGNYAYIEYFPNGMYLTQPMPGYPRRNDLFQVWLRPLRDNNDALFATRAALFELNKLVTEGIGVEEFEASRDFLHKFVAQLTASSSRRLGYALDSDWFGTPAFVDYVRGELASLTRERVNAAVRTHFKLDAAQFVFVAKDAQGLADALAADTPSPITYNTEKPADLLAEDAVIAELPFGLPASRIEVIDGQTVFE
jgi:zinc protease